MKSVNYGWWKLQSPWNPIENSLFDPPLKPNRKNWKSHHLFWFIFDFNGSICGWNVYSEKVKENFFIFIVYFFFSNNSTYWWARFCLFHGSSRSYFEINFASRNLLPFQRAKEISKLPQSRWIHKKIHTNLLPFTIAEMLFQ